MCLPNIQHTFVELGTSVIDRTTPLFLLTNPGNGIITSCHRGLVKRLFLRHLLIHYFEKVLITIFMKNIKNCQKISYFFLFSLLFFKNIL